MTTTVTNVPVTRFKDMQISFTPEEANAWNACMRSSSVMMPMFVTAAMGYSICRVIPPFRAYAKYTALAGGVMGLVISRSAISRLCLVKVASMPNSTLRDRLIEAGYGHVPEYPFRQRQYQGFPLNVQTQVQNSPESVPAEPSTEITFDDYPQMNAYDTYSSINDSSDFHISEDTDLTEPINLQKGVTYDELRHKNRDEFYKKNMQCKASRGSREPPAARETTKQEKTKYGDVWG